MNGQWENYHVSLELIMRTSKSWKWPQFINFLLPNLFAYETDRSKRIFMTFCQLWENLLHALLKLHTFSVYVLLSLIDELPFWFCAGPQEFSFKFYFTFSGKFQAPSFENLLQKALQGLLQIPPLRLSFTQNSVFPFNYYYYYLKIKIKKGQDEGNFRFWFNWVDTSWRYHARSVHFCESSNLFFFNLEFRDEIVYFFPSFFEIIFWRNPTQWKIK